MAVIQRPQGGSKSLWLGSIKTGAGFRVNSRRIRKGGYPKNGKRLTVQANYRSGYAKR